MQRGNGLWINPRINGVSFKRRELREGEGRFEFVSFDLFERKDKCTWSGFVILSGTFENVSTNRN